MSDWQTIQIFTYPHEAYVLRAKLESEGIETQLLDEETIQAIGMYSQALGGTRLQVKQEDVAEAVKIMSAIGYKPYTSDNKSFIERKIIDFTSKIPFLKKLKDDARLLVFLLTVAVILYALISYIGTKI